MTEETIKETMHAIDDMFNKVQSYCALYDALTKFGYDEAAIVSTGGEAFTTSIGIRTYEIEGKSDLVKRNIYQANLWTKIQQGMAWIWKKICQFFKWLFDSIYMWITKRRKEAMDRKAVNLTTIKQFPEDFEAPNMVEYKGFHDGILSLGLAMKTVQTYFDATKEQIDRIKNQCTLFNQDPTKFTLGPDEGINLIDEDFRDHTTIQRLLNREILAHHYRNGYIPGTPNGEITPQGAAAEAACGRVVPPTVVEADANVVELGWTSGTSFKLVEQILNSTMKNLEADLKTMKRVYDDAVIMQQNKIIKTQALYDAFGESAAVLGRIVWYLCGCASVIFNGINTYNNIYITSRDSVIAAYDAYLANKKDNAK